LGRKISESVRRPFGIAPLDGEVRSFDLP